MTIAEALAEARARFPESATASLDARVLLEAVTGKERAALIAADSALIGDDADRYEAAVVRRQAGEPVAYIVGKQEFFGLDFAVGPNVLIPRPESELLVEAAIHAKPQRLLDLGTGSGCLLIAALHALPNSDGIGIDASAEAIAMAFENGETLIAGDRVQWFHARFDDAASLFEDERFDVILANPPYIAEGTPLPRSVVDFEPDNALFSGPDGLDAHTQVAQVMAALLADDGLAYVEIGSDQGPEATELYRRLLAPREVTLHRDAAGLDRMVAITPQPGL